VCTTLGPWDGRKQNRETLARGRWTPFGSRPRTDWMPDMGLDSGPAAKPAARESGDRNTGRRRGRSLTPMGHRCERTGAPRPTTKRSCRSIEQKESFCTDQDKDIKPEDTPHRERPVGTSCLLTEEWSGQRSRRRVESPTDPSVHRTNSSHDGSLQRRPTDWSSWTTASPAMKSETSDWVRTPSCRYLREYNARSNPAM